MGKTGIAATVSRNAAQLEETMAHRVDTRWTWRRFWTWQQLTSFQQSRKRPSPIHPHRPCGRWLWTPGAFAWCSHRSQSGWQSLRCLRRRQTCLYKSPAVRLPDRPAARTQTHSFASRRGFWGQEDTHYIHLAGFGRIKIIVHSSMLANTCPLTCTLTKDVFPGYFTDL